MKPIKLSFAGSGDEGKTWENIEAIIPAEAAKIAHKKGFTFIAEYVNDELDKIYQFNFKTCRYDCIRSDLIFERSLDRYEKGFEL